MHDNCIYYENFNTIAESPNSIHRCILKSIQTVIVTSYSIILTTNFK